MKELALFQLLGDIDDAYVEGAAQPVKKRPGLRVWLPVAACAAAVLLALPLLRGAGKKVPTLHSYVLSEGSGTGDATAEAFFSAGNTSVTVSAAGGEGDRDQEMTAEELRQAMLDAGFSQTEADAFAGDYTMTWAHWWSFYHSYEAGERTLEALAEFTEERGVMTLPLLPPKAGEPVYNGEVVGGAAEPDPNVPAQQEALDAYQHLMAYFAAEYGPGVYPDWYGGAYIVNGNFLIVNIPQRIDEKQTDKSLYLQIQDLAESKSVGFGGVKYSLNELLALQARVTALPELLVLPNWGCGINEQDGQVTLYLPTADEALLAALARLDPADDAIRVSVDMFQADVTAEADGTDR